MTASPLVACIIPDRDIEVVGDVQNRGAVRIVESFLVGPDADMACDEAGGKGVSSCPLPPNSLNSGYIDRGFCVCPEGAHDGRAFNSFNIYLEDPDRDENNDPLDELRGAFLLDMDPQADFLADSVAYRNFLDPTRTALLDPDTSYSESIGRPDPQLRVLTVFSDSFESVDLCNDNESQPLTPGLHTLRVIVTDRDWAVARAELDGTVVEQSLPGVPDLARGATYDTAVYVFNCGEGEQCACETEGP